MKIVWEGLFKKNPVLVLAMGLVPAVAIATTALNGLVLGISIAVILLVSTMINFVLVPLMPENSRLALRVMILLVLVVALYGFTLHTLPELVAGLGIFFPFLVVDAFRLQHTEDHSSFGQLILAHLGQALGFIWALVLIGIIREFLGCGSIFGQEVVAAILRPMSLAKGAPGGLIIVGLLMALTRVINKGGELHD